MNSDNSRPNISINISGTMKGDLVAGDKTYQIDGDYINNPINFYGESSTIIDLAKEVDNLLHDSENSLLNSSSESNQEIVKNNALQEIEKKPVLKQKLLAAIKAGSIKAVEEFCKHPLANVLLAAFKAAFPDKKS
jgi:hypothetical protein